MARTIDDHPELSPAEAARIRARDRRRTTRMVVDNAGVKRLALQRAQSRRRAEDAPGGGPPPRQ